MLVKKANSLELIQMFKLAKTQSPQDARKTHTAILKNLSWIPCSLAARYRKFDNYHDILQTGYLTLFKAILAYDYHKSANIAGYIYPWVKTEIRKEAWREKVYLGTFQFTDDIKSLDKAMVASPEDDFIRSEEILILQNILKKLDKDSENVIVRTFDLDGAGRSSLRELAKEMNVSHETVRKIRTKAIKKITAMCESHRRI